MYTHYIWEEKADLLILGFIRGKKPPLVCNSNFSSSLESEWSYEEGTPRKYSLPPETFLKHSVRNVDKVVPVMEGLLWTQRNRQWLEHGDSALNQTHTQAFDSVKSEGGVGGCRWYTRMWLVSVCLGSVCSGMRKECLAVERRGISVYINGLLSCIWHYCHFQISSKPGIFWWEAALKVQLCRSAPADAFLCLPFSL